MPELPDLEVFSRNLNKELAGKKISKLVFQNKKKLKTPEKEFEEALKKQTIDKVYRSGKELFFEFKNGKSMSFHLMLKGNLYWFNETNTQKYTIVEMHLEDGSGLALTDFQGQASVALQPEPKEAPDAFSEEMNLAFLEAALGKTKAAIKSFLLDQHHIRGIGNAYADEILWEAKISPLSVSNKIPRQQVAELVKAIRSVLQNAVDHISKEHPDIITGEVRDFLKIHHPKKEKSPTGAKIKQTTVGSRNTYYTDEQELYD